ncbi:hypothetical protein C8R43DRAFT_940953 [Mycena crocata]|nr:hypothetical protein C8R43DRAFT_940953 [Mycena crocata]
MSETAVSILSAWATLIPNSMLITAVASALVTVAFVVRALSPKRMMKALDASLHDVERIYFETFETHRFHQLTAEPVTSVNHGTRLIVLEDNAARLRMETLFHGSFFVHWGELWGMFTGQSFAIWRCTRKIQCLGSEMQASKTNFTHCEGLKFS